MTNNELEDIQQQWYKEGFKEAESIYKEKSDKWDELEAEISKYYCNKDGDYDEQNPEVQGDLCDIGEIAAAAMGWL